MNHAQSCLFARGGSDVILYLKTLYELQVALREDLVKHLDLVISPVVKEPPNEVKKLDCRYRSWILALHVLKQPFQLVAITKHEPSNVVHVEDRLHF